MVVPVMYFSSCSMVNCCAEMVSLTTSPIETMPTTSPSLVEHRQVAEVLLGHDRHALIDRLFGRHIEHLVAHDLAHRVSRDALPRRITLRA
jgi:hypothetical protein